MASPSNDNNVIPISRGHKLRNEADQLMHLTGPGKVCHGCGEVHRECVLCGEIDPEDWTEDHGIFANHTNPCTQLPIIGGSDG